MLKLNKLLAPGVVALSLATTFAAHAQQPARAPAPMTAPLDEEQVLREIGERTSYAWETMSPQETGRMYKECGIRGNTALELSQKEISYYYSGALGCIFDKVAPRALDQIGDQIRTIEKNGKPTPQSTREIRALQQIQGAMQQASPVPASPGGRR